MYVRVKMDEMRERCVARDYNCGEKLASNVSCADHAKNDEAHPERSDRSCVK